MERAASRRQRATEAVGRALSGSFKKRRGSFSKTRSSLVEMPCGGLPPAAQAQSEGGSFGKRKALVALPPAMPLKRARTWSSALITLSGGTPQPQRVIGYRRTKTALDMSFRVGGATVEAHRHVIEQNFGAALKLPETKGSPPVELPLPCDPTAFQALIEWCYVGRCEVAEHLIVPFLETAHFCQAGAAVEAACAAFEPYVSAANCLEILFCAQRLNLPNDRLAVAAEARVRTDFEEVGWRGGAARRTLPVAAAAPALSVPARPRPSLRSTLSSHHVVPARPRCGHGATFSSSAAPSSTPSSPTRPSASEARRASSRPPPRGSAPNPHRQRTTRCARRGGGSPHAAHDSPPIFRCRSLARGPAPRALFLSTSPYAQVRALLEPLRYAAMPMSYVRGTVLRHPLVCGHPDRHGLLLESFLQASAAAL